MGSDRPQLDQTVLSRIVAGEASRDRHRLVYVFENGPHPPEPVTAGDLARAGNQLAVAFRGAGLRPGARVAVMLRNHPEFVHTLVANAKLGLATVPIDPRARGERLAWLLGLADGGALVTADYVVADPDASAVIGASGLPTWVLSTPEGRAENLDYPSGWPCLNAILAGPSRPDVGEHVTDPAGPWLVLPATDRSSEATVVEVPWERLALLRTVPGCLGYRPDDIAYTGLTLTGSNALVLALLPPLCGAAHHSVISRWFTTSRLWKICVDYGVTTWASVGETANAVYSLPTAAEDRTHSVRLVTSCGMPAGIWRPFERRYDVSVVEWFGTMAGAFACNPVGAGPIGSFGRPPAGWPVLAVVDADGPPVRAGTVGELAVRLGTGWSRTGHLARRDAEGWFYAAHQWRDDGAPPPVVPDPETAVPKPARLSAERRPLFCGGGSLTNTS